MNHTYLPHEFAKRAGVTIRALHHYDRLGLLKPSGRTAAGYRVYSDRDFARLEQIVALKFIGFPLSQIRELLHRKDPDLCASPSAATPDSGREAGPSRPGGAGDRTSGKDRGDSGGEPDWEPFRKVIEVIQMQTRKDWMKKYYTEEQLANLRQRWSPEVQAESETRLGRVGSRHRACHRERAQTRPAKSGLQLAARRQELLAHVHGWRSRHGAESAKALCRQSQLASEFQEAV